MIKSLTQYDLMSTSTCTPLGGGASRCVYEYRKEVSTTTQDISTSTVNYETVSIIQSLVVIGIAFGAVVAYIVKKLV